VIKLSGYLMYTVIFLKTEGKQQLELYLVDFLIQLASFHSQLAGDRLAGSMSGFG